MPNRLQTVYVEGATVSGRAYEVIIPKERQKGSIGGFTHFVLFRSKLGQVHLSRPDSDPIFV